MDKVLTSTYVTDAIKINLVYKDKHTFGSINDQPLKEFKDVKKFVKKHKLIIGEEELNFIIGFLFSVEKQKKIEENINKNFDNLLSSI